MIIHVKPDRNHRPTYIVEGQGYRPSIMRQVLNGIAIAFKIFFVIVAICIALYAVQKLGLRFYVHGLPVGRL